MRFLYFLIAFFVCWLGVFDFGKKSGAVGTASAQSFEIITKGKASVPKEKPENSKGEISAGFKAFVPVKNFASFQARFFQGFEVKSEENGGKKADLPPRWSGEATLFKDSFPLLFRAGNLSFSQSVSLLKDPSPSSSSSPLKTAFSANVGMKSALPSSSDATKNVSYFIDFSVPKEKLRFPIKASVLLTSDLDFYGASLVEFPFSRLSKFAFSFTAARSYIENESATLKKAGGNFNPRRIFSFCAENAFSSPIFKAKFSIGATQIPWKDSTYAILKNPNVAYEKGWSMWIRSAFRFNLRHFVLDSEAFIAPFYDFYEDTPKAAVFVGTDSGIMRTIKTFSVNPQVAFGNFKIGALTMFQDKITSNDKPARLGLLKTAGAISYSRRTEKNATFSTKFTFSANNILISGIPTPASSAPSKYYSGVFDFSFVRKNIRADLDFSAAVYPPLTEKSLKKTVWKIGADVTPGSKKLFKYSFDWDLTEKEREKTSETFAFGMSFRIPVKKILKISGSVKLELKTT